MGCGAGANKNEKVEDPAKVKKTEDKKEAPKATPGENKCILIIGAPASGKGTQAEKIKKLYGFL